MNTAKKNIEILEELKKLKENNIEYYILIKELIELEAKNKDRAV